MNPREERWHNLIKLREDCYVWKCEWKSVSKTVFEPYFFCFIGKFQVHIFNDTGVFWRKDVLCLLMFNLAYYSNISMFLSRKSVYIMLLRIWHNLLWIKTKRLHFSPTATEFVQNNYFHPLKYNTTWQIKQSNCSANQIP